MQINETRGRVKHDLLDLARCFDEVELYLHTLGLTSAHENDIKDLAYRRSITAAMAEAFKAMVSTKPLCCYIQKTQS